MSDASESENDPTLQRFLKGLEMLGKVTLSEKLGMFSEMFAPRTVGVFNGHDIMVAKVLGEFVWHSHDETDDFFLVLNGQLIVRFRDQGDIVLNPGELLIIPMGVEHQPYAPAETHVLLIERSGTPNTGDTATAAPRIEI